MKLLATLFLGMCLWALCWPLVLLALMIWPVLWLISIPFRIVGVVVEALIAGLKAFLFLPARLLGSRPAKG